MLWGMAQGAEQSTGFTAKGLAEGLLGTCVYKLLLIFALISTTSLSPITELSDAVCLLNHEFLEGKRLAFTFAFPVPGMKQAYNEYLINKIVTVSHLTLTTQFLLTFFLTPSADSAGLTASLSGSHSNMNVCNSH